MAYSSKNNFEDVVTVTAFNNVLGSKGCKITKKETVYDGYIWSHLPTLAVPFRRKSDTDWLSTKYFKTTTVIYAG